MSQIQIVYDFLLAARFCIRLLLDSNRALIVPLGLPGTLVIKDQYNNLLYTAQMEDHLLEFFAKMLIRADTLQSRQTIQPW